MGASRYRLRNSPLLFLLLCLALLLSGGLFGCGEDEVRGEEWETTEPDNQEPGDADSSEEEEEELDGQFPDASNAPPSHVVAIKTRLVSPQVMSAGDQLEVECDFIDLLGEVVEFAENEGPETRVLRSPNDAFERRGVPYFARKAGQAEVACQSLALGLTDPAPIEITIEPGPAHTTNIHLDRTQITAGENVQASCEAFDAWGNEIHETTFQINSDRSTSGLAINQGEKRISVTTAGIYTFSCHKEGVQNLFGRTLDVVPDLPSELLVNVVPFQNVYGIGQVITVATIAQDRFGNEVPNAQVAFSATPSGEYFGAGRFRFWENGIYTLRAEVTSPTYTGTLLVNEIEIVVNDSGPAINCTEPFDGQMIQHNPGSNLVFRGTASDALGVSEVLVNGSTANVESDGSFAFTIQPRYGINFVDIVARDDFDEESVRTCAFLASPQYSSATSYLTDAVSLRLSQDAIDDQAYDPNNVRSLNDIILTVLNSDGLRQTLLQQLQASQPYDVDFCNFDLRVLGVSYLGTPHITSINLVGGGLRLFARLNDIRIHLRLSNGSGFGCWGSYEPRATLSFVQLQLTSDVDLNNSTNLPQLSLREVEFVQSGNVSLSGGNVFSTALYSALDSLFQGTLRGLIEDTFEGAVSDNFNDLFDDLIGSLDIDALATQIEVPRLDSDNTLSLNFGFNFSYANANSSRLLFGIAPRIVPQGGAAHAIPSLGVPRPTGTIREAPADSAAGVGVHISLLNQALHSLWRAGLFHANIGATLFGDDVPDGTAVLLQAALPPMAILDPGGSTATIHLGGLNLSIQYPGLFDDPVGMTLGATASTQINLDGDEISFTNIQLDEFHLSPDEISLNEGSRDILEGFLRGLIQDVLDQSLNAALPALPIPSFSIPPSMSEYNLPVGSEFGVKDPVMSQTNRHLLLRGDFGIR